MKTLFTLLTAALIFISHGVFSQEDSTEAKGPWKTGGVGNLNFNQVSLTNWAGGGQSSISGGAFLNLFAKYKKGKSQWDNTLDLAFGLIQQIDGPVVKSDDRIEFNSKYGQQATEKWFYSALLSFRTQFAPGFDDPAAVNPVVISDFLSPAYVMASLGFDYKPNDNFTALISPLTNKTTIVMDQNLADAGAFGVTAAEFDDLGNLVTAGENIRFEVGAFIKAAWNKDIFENVNFQTKIDLFSNYLNNPGNIDINWENLVAMKVNKWLTTSLSTHLIYDDDIKVGVDTNNDDIVDAQRVRTQFKQVLAAGISYKF